MKKIVFAVIACLMMLSSMAAPASAQTPRTAFEGTEYFVTYLAPGDRWITGDGVLHVRGAEELYLMDVDDPRLNGDFYLTYNANLHLADPPVFAYGPLSGSFTIVNEGGNWEGHFAGMRTREGFNYFVAELRGYGDYAGMHAHAYFAREETNLVGPMTVQGFIW